MHNIRSTYSTRFDYTALKRETDSMHRWNFVVRAIQFASFSPPRPRDYYSNNLKRYLARICLCQLAHLNPYFLWYTNLQGEEGVTMDPMSLQPWLHCEFAIYERLVQNPAQCVEGCIREYVT